MMKQAGDSATAPAPPLTFTDALSFSLIALGLFLVSYFRSRNRMFWSDEIMGALTLGQPSWSGVLKFWHAGIDSSGIWYYVFVRQWVAFFGIGELSLRLFSAAGVIVSAGILWITARRFYSIWPVAASISFVYSSTSALRWQLSNGRCYGVFMVAAALVLYLTFRGEDDSNRRPSPLFLFATFAAYALLAGSHILGALYVVGFLGIQILLDLAACRFRPTLYVAALCSFVVVVFSHANLHATAALGKPSFWTVRPALRYLINFTVVTDPRVHDILLDLFLLAFFALRLRRRRIPVYVALAGFLALDALMFEISRHSTSIYVDRYMVPFALALVLLMCELFTQLREADLPLAKLRSALPVPVLLLAIWNAVHPDPHDPWLPTPNYTAELLQSLPLGPPVIDTDVGSFVELHYYHPDGLGHTLLYPTDWPVALDRANTGGVSGFHEMDNFKAVGIYADSIQPTSQILAQNGDFLVITGHGPSPNLWLERRIRSNPRYRLEYLGLFQNDINYFDIWQVHTL